MSIMNQDSEKHHIAFLHHKFGNVSEDTYLLDLATAVQEAGNTVTIYSSEDFIGYEDIKINASKLSIKPIKCLQKWIPKSWNFVKSIAMALNLLWSPPNPPPKLMVLDIHPIAVLIFSLFGKIKTVYIAHLSSIKYAPKISKTSISLLTATSLKYTENIIVKSECLAKILQRSLPSIGIQIRVIYPTVETGIWKEGKKQITAIIPNQPKPRYRMFVCFGSYNKRSNFHMLLEAFENLLSVADERIKDDLRLVIAGNIKDKEQNTYCYDLIKTIECKPFSSQISFIKELTTIDKKTLIENALGVMFPTKDDISPTDILATLCAGTPIIATPTGFAKEAVKHQVNSILIKPNPQLFAAAMKELLTNLSCTQFLRDMGKYHFSKYYNYEIFKTSINLIVDECISDKFK